MYLFEVKKEVTTELNKDCFYYDKSHQKMDEDEINPAHSSNEGAPSNLSRPQGFENWKRSPSHTSKCSTSFARYCKKDIKGR